MDFIHFGLLDKAHFPDKNFNLCKRQSFPSESSQRKNFWATQQKSIQ